MCKGTVESSQGGSCGLFRPAKGETLKIRGIISSRCPLSARHDARRVVQLQKAVHALCSIFMNTHYFCCAVKKQISSVAVSTLGASQQECERHWSKYEQIH
ncbi:hypothetical protein XU18_0708 [Perkinsela sp. CCAP 1560/4]|nr:hypothetical protein XU18_4514 [Perkinsela sp. CCAP 1560/4]KNH08938.1 hypothetical protein XU18_0708 [Perkinsela sp. CCAP 1560/4]|eukprot:KNH04304.1 hypothetical protein XU18_4514 [Perkinsela sp. CCAP 1560/4]